MPKEKQQYGQYMTPKIIADFMISLIEHDKNSKILEPSCGNGVFIDDLHENGFNFVTAYEIDEDIIKNKNEVINSSFISSSLNEKFDVVIGNPPYIRWKNLESNLKTELDNNYLWNTYCNSLCDYSNIFIIKSIEQLNLGGELIFITPEYWLSTTNARLLRNYMLKNGCVKKIYHFNETPIFEHVNVSLIIFKYIKGLKENKNISITKFFSKKKISESDIKNINEKSSDLIESFEIPQFKQNERWILADINTQKEIKKFEKKCTKTNKDLLFYDDSEYEKLGNYCDIGNGMVSGLDKAFKIQLNLELNDSEMKSLLKVVKAKDILQYYNKSETQYIFLNNKVKSETELIKLYPHFYEQLNKFKDLLLKRYNYEKDIHYWEWSFLRNYKLFTSNSEKIFVPCKERITKKNRFRFSYAEPSLIPTQDVTAIYKKETTKENILYILAILNSRYVFNWLKYKGIRKGDIIEFSEKPISIIPFRTINFSNSKEKELHDKIVSLVKKYLLTKNIKLLNEIDTCIDTLMEF